MIDVIIPVYNQYRLVQACLELVLDVRDPSQHEVIVIDDCSTDASCAPICRNARPIGPSRY